jgi:hypothetical protein
MDGEALVDINVSHEDPDEIWKEFAAEEGDLDRHCLTVEGNRLIAGQSDTELRSHALVPATRPAQPIGIRREPRA